MLVIELPYIENVWLAFFWWRRQKFQSIFEIAPKIFFVFFFQPQNDFRTQTNIFYVYNVVLDIPLLDFFPFLFITFFKNA